ncbi:MAG: hypothetical protein EXS08_10210 [Planctomycetes bacterium]|nr:hypothetical protein [Planctomycetota bacterium]
MKIRIHRAAALAVGLALVSSLSAQAITGRVVSSTGAGLAGVNIDGFDSNGNALTLSNDGTNATGNFTTTVDDGPGVYTFYFYPPAPPASTHLVAERVNVVVATTTNLGNVTCGAGVLLTGRAVRLTSTPVANVTLSVIDGPTGAPVLQNQTKTSAFGTFSLAVPAHEIELRLDATTSGFVLGSRALVRTPTGALALGDILLAAGATVTGHVQRTNGTAVAGCDLDFKNANGVDVYVPNDNTVANGNFSVVVPKGTYTVRFTAKLTDLLATKELVNTNLNSNTNLGNVVMNAGVKLFGSVLKASGAPAAHVDVDAFNHLTQVKIPLGRDNTDAAGAYAVVLPTGTYDIKFLRDGAGAAIGADWHRNVVINAQTQLNGQLPAHGYGGAYSGPLPPRTVTPLVAGTGGGKAAGAGGHAPGSSLNPPTIVLSADALALEVGGLGAFAPVLLAVGETRAAVEGGLGAPRARVVALRADELGVARLALSEFGPAALFLRALVPGAGASATYLLE